MPLAVSQTPLDVAGNPDSGGLGCPAQLGLAWLGSVSAVQLLPRWMPRGGPLPA